MCSKDAPPLNVSLTLCQILAGHQRQATSCNSSHHSYSVWTGRAQNTVISTGSGHLLCMRLFTVTWSHPINNGSLLISIQETISKLLPLLSTITATTDSLSCHLEGQFLCMSRPLPQPHHTSVQLTADLWKKPKPLRAIHETRGWLLPNKSLMRTSIGPEEDKW